MELLIDFQEVTQQRYNILLLLVFCCNVYILRTVFSPFTLNINGNFIQGFFAAILPFLGCHKVNFIFQHSSSSESSSDEVTSPVNDNNTPRKFRPTPEVSSEV